MLWWSEEYPVAVSLPLHRLSAHQKRFIHRLLTWLDFLPVWLVADKQLAWRWKVMYRTDCNSAHSVLLNRLSKVNTSCGLARADLHLLVGKWSLGRDSACLCLTGALLRPQKASLDIMSSLYWFVSYRRLSPQFQFSLSAVTLGIYLGAAHRLKFPFFTYMQWWWYFWPSSTTVKYKKVADQEQ